MCCHSKIFLLNHRFSCVPVDFEVVNVNSSSTSEDDIKNAIMAIRRNGVALKGLCIQLLIDNVIIVPLLLVSFYSTNCLYLIIFIFFFSGNIETNHTMPPNHKSRNNLLR